MPYDEDEDEFEGSPGERMPLDENIRKALRGAEKARKEAEAMKAEAESAKLEVLYFRAGIPEDGMGPYFRRGYSGEKTVEAIKQAWADAHPQAAPGEQESGESYDSSELEALRRTQGATIGSSGATPDVSQQYLDALAAAQTPEEVLQVVLGDSGKKVGVYTARSAY